MKTLALDPTTGDLVKRGGRPVLVTGADAVAQKLRMRFRFALGDWFRDRRVGIPFARILGVKGADAYAESVFRRVVTTCPGVASLDAFGLTLGSDRRARVTFRATPTEGESIEVADFVAGV